MPKSKRQAAGVTPTKVQPEQRAAQLATAERSDKETAAGVARALHAKKALDIRVLRVDDILQICSYFVIATGTSSRHLQGLADAGERFFKTLGSKRIGIEGYAAARWICLDYADVVVHLFDREAREFYDFDHLWADAPDVKVTFPAGDE